MAKIRYFIVDSSSWQITSQIIQTERTWRARGAKGDKIRYCLFAFFSGCEERTKGRPSFVLLITHNNTTRVVAER